MTKDEALKLALEALEKSWNPVIPSAERETNAKEAIAAVKKALAQPEQVSEYECRKLLYGFMLDCNAVGLEQAGKNLHRSMKEKST